ncbi:MAG TPA: PHP domain-containing protein [Victivallales bacterium]|nr:PHP domain-containing protein [Victivallales bacterium]
MYADLHIHTNASDGTYNVDELLSEVKKKNITLFAITDHDSISNALKMLNNLENYNGRFIMGCESSCSYEGKIYHITSYDFDYNNEEFLKLIDKNSKIWIQYNDDIVEYLAAGNSNISINKYRRYQNNPSRGGSKAINFLIDEGIINSFEDLIKLAKNFNCSMEFNLPELVIDIIKKAGGTPFLAHPNAYNKRKRLPYNDLDKWLEFGIEGIECFSPYCTDEDTKFYIDYCNANNILISGGSDCHGDFLPERKLGKPVIIVDKLRLTF